MKKTYLKMNINDEHLSLGNLFRVIKELSKNKTSALQTEIFCTIFEIEDINDTTVNNYCVGCRRIGNQYKQLFLNKLKKYQKNKDEFTDILINITNIIEGNINIVNKDKIIFINNNASLLQLSKKLINIAKNDKQVPNDTIFKYNTYLKQNNLYELLIALLTFIIVDKKQPLFEEELKYEVLEDILNDTSISSTDLKEYLSLKLREGINFEYSLKKLASKGNAYANYELGSNEYYGYISGEPRYDKAYEYLILAANLNHASANYMLGNMYLNGYLGNQTNDDYKIAYDYLLKASELGNIAAINSLGNMYKEGLYVKKDLSKALTLYNQASLNNYAFAYNNLGKIAEENNNYKESFDYYLIAADLKESWACNKVGEYYRQRENDFFKAFTYYNYALESNYKNRCYYAYYNLAKYFYLNGNGIIPILKDYNKAINYFNIASNNNIFEADIELFYIFLKNYLSTKKDYDKLLYYKNKIENNPKCTPKIIAQIEKEITNIKKHLQIDIDL